MLRPNEAFVTDEQPRSSEALTQLFLVDIPIDENLAANDAAVGHYHLTDRLSSPPDLYGTFDESGRPGVLIVHHSLFCGNQGGRPQRA
jgi:hypothetical protein